LKSGILRNGRLTF
jgi:small subunit ribosomal protein S17e